jgi:hypothetical protein
MKSEMKLLRAIQIFAIIFWVTGSVSCAWWQKHGGQVECTGIATVENALQLLTIVTSCTAIATEPPAIIPCIQSAAGSKWATDVVDCFTRAVAGVVVCPAVPKTIAAPSPETVKRLREALRSQ